MELREYLRTILARARLILLTTLVTVVVATAGGFMKTPRYEATTTVLIKSALTQSQVNIPGIQLSATQDIQRKGETFGRILKSRVIAEKTVDILGLDRKVAAGSKTDPRLAAVKTIQNSISARLLSKTSIMEISVLYPDRELAADIANTAARVFVDHIGEMNSAEARAAKEFIMERVSVAEADLKAAQDRLREFIAVEGAIYPESKANLVLAEFVSFETALKNTQTEIEQARKKIEEIRRRLSEADRTLKTSTTTIINPVIHNLKTKLVDVEVRKANLASELGPRHPRILALTEEAASIRRAIDGEVKRIVENEVTSINPVYQQLMQELVTKEIDYGVFVEKERAIRDIISTFPVELRLSAEKQIEWDTLTNSVKFAQKNLDSLKSQLETARISEARKISEIKVIDPAIPPTSPKGIPPLGYTLIGLVVGLLGGASLAFLIEYLDDSIKTIEAVEEDLQLPVYGVIPRIGSSRKRRRRRKKEEGEAVEVTMLEERLITHLEPKSPIAEAYRSFRTNIQFTDIDERTKILLFTSSVKGEGKTTTSANLAITMAQLGNRTLLVDADMRNPMVHAVFGLEREPGLSNIIGGFGDLKSVVKPSGIRNLDIITSGPIPPNPSELLNSKRLDMMIERLRDRYDFIIFDTPPIIAVTDAAVLCSKVHGAFLVIRGGQTSRRLCERAKGLLEKVNANLLGAVINNVRMSSRYGYEYYYQYYYGEQKGSRKKRRRK
ncbi:MAG TPA: polysaccharide biosynthesis tyrosine autokinase [Deltaproteobacteria bacterium]|nr:polysaccharide biosynthesis tyrosine autokinase [Deltaproteobacteria bacterium]